MVWSHRGNRFELPRLESFSNRNHKLIQKVSLGLLSPFSRVCRRRPQKESGADGGRVYVGVIIQNRGCRAAFEEVVWVGVEGVFLTDWNAA